MLDATIQPDDLAAIADAGGSLEVDGGAYTLAELQDIARRLKPGARLTIIRNAGRSAGDMARIAAAKPGQVSFG
jgi:hypothetical protein